MKEELYIKLLQKELSGGLNPSEKKSLDEWLKQSIDNQLIAESIRKAWQLSEGYSKDIYIDLDAEFLQLESRIDEPEAVIVKMKPARNWLKIAAAIIVLIVSVFGISRFLQEDIHWVTQNTSENQVVELTLADGSKISLNQNSTFTYPENFNTQERRVKLSGEAFFEVFHNPNAPFIIEGRNGETTVLGTSFNVRNYALEARTIVTVRDGKVRFSPNGSTQHVDLTAKEKAVFDKERGTLIKSKDERLVAIKWHSKVFDFEDTPLEQALDELGKAYNIEFEILDEKLKSCPLTGNYERKELNVIFQYLEISYGMKFIEVAPKKYKVEGGNC